jgi:hypothetical protein
MNVVYIILGVIGIIIVYYLYVYFTSSVTTLANIIDCSKGTTYVDGSKISSPSSSNFGYGLWIYINNWYTTSAAITNIFYRNGTSSSKNTIHVFLDSNSPKLYVQFSKSSEGNAYTKKSSATSPDNLPILVTSNFPLQKWVYLFVSVDAGQYVDVYLDGKMVKTAVLTNPTIPEGSATSTSGTTTTAIIPGLTIGPYAGYATTFQSFGYAVDPQTVWNYYMRGNGTALGTNYGVSMSVLKNEEESSKYRIF